MKFIALIDDEPAVLEFYSAILERKGYQTKSFETSTQFFSELDRYRHEFDLILMDYNLPEIEAEDLLSGIKQKTNSPILIFTSQSNIPNAISIIRMGAFDYIEKNFQDTEKLTLSIQRALDHRKLMIHNTELKSENKILREEKRDRSSSLNSMGSKNRRMQKLINSIDHFSKVSTHLLFHGHEGVGKEVMAKYLHQLTGSKAENFFSLNTQSLTPEEIHLTLFGDQSTPGVLSKGQEATLFIDEVTQLSLATQSKLLTFIQEGSLKLRIIFSTNVELNELTEGNKLSKDFYHSISTLQTYIPSLKERREDIIDLATSFLRVSCKKYNKNIIGFNESALQSLSKYEWPGNIRELKNTVERSVILSDDKLIGAVHLGLHNLNKSPGLFNSNFEPNFTLKEIEVEYTKHVIDYCNGDLPRAAKILGVSKRTIYRKIQDKEKPLSLN